MNSDLRESTGLDHNGLIACERDAAWGLGVQNVLAGYKGNAEASLFIRLELCDLDTIPTEDRQRRLIRLVGAFLTLLDDRTHGSDQYLPFDSTAPRRGL